MTADLLNRVSQWFQSGRRVALATVVEVTGSSPRECGSLMAVNDQQAIAGSVSGGCVEAAVVETALQVIQEGQGRLLRFGPVDELDFSVGLTCGGTLQIWVERLDLEFFHLWLSYLEKQDPVVACTVLTGSPTRSKFLVSTTEVAGSEEIVELDEVIREDVRLLLTSGKPQLRPYLLASEECRVFLQPFVPLPHLILFGATEYARALCQVGSLLGFRVTVCDARAWFAKPERFPEADAVVVEWPQDYLKRTRVTPSTVIMVLNHDPKFDVPALVAAVKTSAAYIGAMGSRQAQTDRARRLREAGLAETDLARISAPLGLDIGATTPEETAISILAEVIALRSGRSGGRLAAAHGSIHSRQLVETDLCPK